MYSVKVHNQDEISKVLNKINKRKGKTISAKELQDGDLFRHGDYGLNIYHQNDGHFSVFSAWADLLGQMCVGSGGRAGELNDVPVKLLAHKNEYPQPIKDSPITTIIHKRNDEGYCCQNMIFYHVGQHFRITAEKLAELKTKGDRQWEDSPMPCNCELELGQVKEYDGHIHELEN
jgi:hypothetical protein